MPLASKNRPALRGQGLAQRWLGPAQAGPNPGLLAPPGRGAALAWPSAPAWTGPDLAWPRLAWPGLPWPGWAWPEPGQARNPGGRGSGRLNFVTSPQTVSRLMADCHVELVATETF